MWVFRESIGVGCQKLCRLTIIQYASYSHLFTTSSHTNHFRMKNKNCEKEMQPVYQSFYGNTPRFENIWSYIPGFAILDLKQPMPYRIGGLVKTVINLNPLHLSTVKSQPDSHSHIFQTLHVPSHHSSIAQPAAAKIHQLQWGQQTNKSQSYTGMSTRPSKYNWHFTPYRKNTGLILCVINIPQWTTAATVIKNNDRLLPMNWMIRTAKE